MVKEKQKWPGPDALLDARKRRIRWTVMAATVRSAIGETSSLPQRERTRWLARAAELSGYTTGALRRFANVLDFLEAFEEDARPGTEEAKDSFTALEMVHRISRHDPKRAAELMGELRTGSIAISKLRAELKDSKSKRLSKDRKAVSVEPLGYAFLRVTPPSPASERNWRADAALEGIRILLPTLSRRFEYFGRPSGNAPSGWRCDAIAWLDASWTRGDGFEIVHAPASTAKAVVSDRISRAIVASRFFRRHYIVFTPESGPDHVYRTAQSLEQLEAVSIGVVWLSAEKPLVRKPTGLPEPDRIDKLCLVCPQGKWNENYNLASPRK